jgi:acetyl-CoA C-acetyltransferase
VIFLASEARARAYAKARGLKLSDLARIDGWGHRTAPMLLSEKLQESRNSRFVLPQVHQAIRECFDRAGIADVFQLDAIETHDCFAMTEYAAIDCFGITEPGEAWKAVEAGVIAADGRLPINPSGGLIGLGHPVGATGVRMMLDGYRQVTGRAGECQVKDAKRVGLLNIGGSTTTIASFVVGRGE